MRTRIAPITGEFVGIPLQSVEQLNDGDYQLQPIEASRIRQITVLQLDDPGFLVA